MRQYDVKLTEEAKQDRKSLARFIKEEVQAPLTAKRYMLHHIIPQKMIVYPVIDEE